MPENLHPAALDDDHHNNDHHDDHSESIIPAYQSNSKVNGTTLKGGPNQKAHALTEDETAKQVHNNNNLVGGSNSQLHGAPVGECHGVTGKTEVHPPQDIAPTISPKSNPTTGTENAAKTAVGTHATNNCTGKAPSPEEIKQPQAGGSKTKKRRNKKGRKTKKNRNSRKNKNSRKNHNFNKNRKVKGILKKNKKTKNSNNSNKNKKSRKTKKVRFYK